MTPLLLFLALGGDFTCVLEKGEVRCFGSEVHGESLSPRFVNTRRISAGLRHGCGIDDNGLRCWGENVYRQATPPEALLLSAKDIAAGERHSCALDAQGVKCWGDNASGQTSVPDLKDPKAVFAGGDHSCAIDGYGLVCWGYGSPGRKPVPDTSKPKVVATGGAFTCILDDAGVRCWGRPGFGETDVPPLKNPRALAAGSRHACAIDDSGVKCWGDATTGATRVPPLKNPTAIAAGGAHSCAVADGGIRCWGSNSHGQLGERPDFVLTDGLSDAHERYVAELSRPQREELAAAYRTGRIVDRCQSGEKLVLAVLTRPDDKKKKKGEGVRVVHLGFLDAPGSAKILPIGREFPTICNAETRRCPVGRLRCLAPEAMLDFLKETRADYRMKKVPTSPSVCVREVRAKGRWDCFKYDDKKEGFRRWAEWRYR